MFPYPPPTAEEGNVIGCVVVAVSLILVALALYANVRTGFKDSEGVHVLLGCVVLATTVGLVWYFVRRYANRL